jgi:hypothetical protein
MFLCISNIIVVEFGIAGVCAPRPPAARQRASIRYAVVSRESLIQQRRGVSPCETPKAKSVAFCYATRCYPASPPHNKDVEFRRAKLRSSTRQR